MRFNEFFWISLSISLLFTNVLWYIVHPFRCRIGFLFFKKIINYIKITTYLLINYAFKI
jgi:hypothetical protein